MGRGGGRGAAAEKENSGECGLGHMLSSSRRRLSVDFMLLMFGDDTALTCSQGCHSDSNLGGDCDKFVLDFLRAEQKLN